MENEVKEPASKYNYVSPEQYLEMERASEEKHEYYKGEIFAMSGASWRHNVIVKNINTKVLPFLVGKPCNMFGSDLRIHIPENSLYTYPGLSIICGQPETTDDEKDTVVRPSVLIEVLSKSTKVYDRGTKFHLYRSIPTLQEYILIDSTFICIEIYKRLPDNRWQLTDLRNLTDSFTISTIGLSIQLHDVYHDVSFNE
ncbi:MAG: Uma2 family endonuclease [Chitinophagaceae bacterium]|nr:Uma2 family endonuclease [Chitinophagaceae bacterium]